MILDEKQLDALQSKYRKIGTVDFSGHQLVFRVPTRDEVRDYRRKEDSPAEQPDRGDQLAQQTIVAYDGETDTTRAREAFTSSFLEEFPMAIDSPKFQSVLGVLSGSGEEAHAKILGKGCSVMSAATRASRTDSANGSAAIAPTTPMQPAHS